MPKQRKSGKPAPETESEPEPEPEPAPAEVPIPRAARNIMKRITVLENVIQQTRDTMQAKINDFQSELTQKKTELTAIQAKCTHDQVSKNDAGQWICNSCLQPATVNVGAVRPGQR